MNENKVKKIFIDRQREQEIIFETLDKLANNHSSSTRESKPIINFWGVGGIGKTEFFKQIPQWLPIGWKFTYFDLASTETEPDNQQAALVGLKNALKQQAQIELELDSRQITPTDLARHVQTWLKTQQDHLVLVLDNLERSRGWVDKLQQLLLSLPVDGRILVVTGSRNNSLLTNYSLRIKLQSHQLKVFEVTELLENELAQELKARLFEEDYKATRELATQLLKLSLGYPQALNYLLDQLPASSTEAALLFLTDHLPQLKIALMQMVLDSYATLPNLQELRQQQFNVALREMSIFRLFNDTILKDTLKKPLRLVDQKLFAARNSNPLYFTRLAQDMKMLNLAYWDNKRYGYYIDENYRRLLIQGLEAENLAEYITRQQNATLKYLSLLQTANLEVETQAVYLVEFLYHLVTLGRLQPEIYNPHLYNLEKYIQVGQIPSEYFRFFNLTTSHTDTIKLPSIQLLKEVFYAKETQELNLTLKSTLKNIDEVLFDWL